MTEKQVCPEQDEMANAIQQTKFQIQAPITKHYASTIKKSKLLLSKLVSLFASRNSQSLYSRHCDVLGIVRNIEVSEDVIVAIHGYVASSIKLRIT